MSYTTNISTSINSVSLDQNCQLSQRLELAGVLSQYAHKLNEQITSTTPLHLTYIDGDLIYGISITSSGLFEVSLFNDGANDIYSGIEQDKYFFGSTAGSVVQHFKVRTSSADPVMLDILLVGSSQ